MMLPHAPTGAPEGNAMTTEANMATIKANNSEEFCNKQEHKALQDQYHEC